MRILALTLLLILGSGCAGLKSRDMLEAYKVFQNQPRDYEVLTIKGDNLQITGVSELTVRADHNPLKALSNPDTTGKVIDAVARVAGIGLAAGVLDSAVKELGDSPQTVAPEVVLQPEPIIITP